ncbi:MAG: radical SAM protein [Euryarchaeota archaeon]|nr:radical SAM protein [Euryarchaeota archaeon]
MKILLIQPYAGYEKPNLLMKLSANLPALPNLTLQQLAGICPDEYEIQAVDENRGSKIDFNEEYDIIAISCRTATAPRAYEIADEFRRRGIKVVLGGYHPSALPEEAKQHADAVVIGEAEISFAKVIEDIKKRNLKQFYQSGLVDPKLIPPPRRDIIDYYLSIAAVEATRGCPVNCDFCFVHKVKGKIHRKRPLENVIDEMKTIKQKNIMFFDASLTTNPPYTKTLFKSMIELNKRFTCYGNVNVLAKDDEFLKLASDAGCMGWCIGFESISQNILKSIGKTTNKVEDYKNAVKKIKDYNMNITGSFIFGFDDHVTDTFKETMEMIKQLDIDMACFNVLTPFPGTPLFERIKNEKRIASYDWARYTCAQTVFQPKNMTEKELYDGTIWVLKDFYKNIPTLKRILKNIKHGYHPFINSLLGNCLWYARKFDPGRN